MAFKKDPGIVKEELRSLLSGFAKSLNRRVYGSEGVPLGTSLADMEAMAVELGKLMSASMVEDGIKSQAPAAMSEPGCCGVCGGPIDPTGSSEPRAVLTSVGTAQWDDPEFYCRQCRAAFFPSDSRVGD
jgi:hypothetical protein